jgi:cytochrome c oxidase assembly protein subunit 15
MSTAFPSSAATGSRKTNPPKPEDLLPTRRLHRYASFLAGATFLLVIAGGLVTSTGSALAVPDWPLAFGQYFPKMEGGVLYEHGHRMIAGVIGLLTFILGIWLWREERRQGVRNLGMAAIAIVISQAALGGITVMYRLPVAVSTAHAALGQVFFTVLVMIAVLTGTQATRPAAGKATRLQRLGLLTVGFIFLQLLAGAYLRHTGKGLHVHLTGAVLVTVHILLLVKRFLREMPGHPALRRIALALPLLVIIQITLGYFAWKSGPIVATTTHVAIGALLLAACSVLTMQAFRQQPAGT